MHTDTEEVHARLEDGLSKTPDPPRHLGCYFLLRIPLHPSPVFLAAWRLGVNSSVFCSGLFFTQRRQGAKSSAGCISKARDACSCASIDFGQGHRWKQAGGIYFISLAKENMKPEVIGRNRFDPHDPINRGVQADGPISTSQHVLTRRIRYIHPANGEAFEFSCRPSWGPTSASPKAASNYSAGCGATSSPRFPSTFYCPTCGISMPLCNPNFGHR